MSEEAVYGTEVVLRGPEGLVSGGWWPARYIVACDEDGQRIPGLSPRRLAYEVRGGAAFGVAEGWPGVNTTTFGVLGEEDGPILWRVAVLSAPSAPGDTVNIGPLVREPASSRA